MSAHPYISKSSSWSELKNLASRYYSDGRVEETEMGSSLLCSDCGKRFGQLCNLKQHLRTHTGFRPYVCPQCPRSFKQLGHLQTHLRSIHTGERPYSCPVETCSSSFHQLGNLKGHLKRAHGPDAVGRLSTMHSLNDSLPCPLCGSEFGRKSYLRSHFSRCHSDYILSEDLEAVSTKFLMETVEEARPKIVVKKVAPSSFQFRTGSGYVGRISVVSASDRNRHDLPGPSKTEPEPDPDIGKAPLDLEVEDDPFPFLDSELSDSVGYIQSLSMATLFG